MAVCAVASYEQCAHECKCKAVVEAELKAPPRPVPATPLSWVRSSTDEQAQAV